MISGWTRLRCTLNLIYKMKTYPELITEGSEYWNEVHCKWMPVPTHWVGDPVRLHPDPIQKRNESRDQIVCQFYRTEPGGTHKGWHDAYWYADNSAGRDEIYNILEGRKEMGCKDIWRIIHRAETISTKLD